MKEHRAVEDVQIAGSELMGPTSSRDWENKTFKITFNRDTKTWLEGERSELRIVHEKYRTVGEANRGQLHELLESFINDMINETVTREGPI